MNAIDGIILVDKPTGMTSHDVVDYIRKALKIKRVGHTGILDPNATGLMVILLGKGTLLSKFLTNMPKRYVSRFAFGQETDTFDADGTVLASSDAGNVDPDEFEKLLGSFRGEVEQIVPPFSAAKRNGIASHRLARRGARISPKHKVVRIEKIKVIDFDWPEVSLDIRCQSGTYVRSIAHQMGRALGCGGHLKSLRRLEVGPFQVSGALTLEEITGSDNIMDVLKPLKNALPSAPLINIKPQYYGAVLNGRPLYKKYIGGSNYSGDGGVVSLLMGPDDKVLALANLNMHWRVMNKLGPSEIMGSYIRVIDEGHLRS
ncbi:MAG: tRNA pseudouridine(55) synthase TruB [Candidatus Zixiibacteriota bacterium]|nr:MAG: tRNA pseudouridine(55) synthase TruB [candidate division Zixibacteria bacterium]